MLHTVLILALAGAAIRAPGVGRPHAVAAGESPASARPPAQRQVEAPGVEAVVDWLGSEVHLTFTQMQRVRSVLQLEHASRAAARAKGLDVESTPPAARERTVERELSQAQSRRRSRSAMAVLRAANRRRADAEWLAEDAARTELHTMLRGLRVTALDGILRVLSVEQTKRYRELLGTQGVDWVRQLAQQRSKPPAPLTPAQRLEVKRAAEFEQAEKERVATEARARADAKRKARAEEQRGRGGRGGNGRGRGQGQGRRRR